MLAHTDDSGSCQAKADEPHRKQPRQYAVTAARRDRQVARANVRQRPHARLLLTLRWVSTALGLRRADFCNKPCALP